MRMLRQLIRSRPSAVSSSSVWRKPKLRQKCEVLEGRVANIEVEMADRTRFQRMLSDRDERFAAAIFELGDMLGAHGIDYISVMEKFENS
jgi:hypothetical protein